MDFRYWYDGGSRRKRTVVVLGAGASRGAYLENPVAPDDKFSKIPMDGDFF